ncbi:hypothetical protein GP486_007103 [Trichoglossum hirsutum]|uniref:Uncharacterized protein n=1 Tax=Trichoglossum hirsutum TaxID=265104 RepID=A0A9P8ICI9_9PEZI|nr:hypothetical protein GP486_007103 [Trichoglossum hirsutum]
MNEWAQLPISPAEYQEKAAALHREKFTYTQPLPGAPTLVHNLAYRSAPQVHIALATSSHRANYNVKTQHLGHVFSAFHDERRVLGDDPRILAGAGKPAPDIFLLALQTINDGIRGDGNEPEIKPEECLVFEDSVPGIEAGRRAGMRVVWVPHPGLLKEYHGREGQVLAGLAGQHEGTGPGVVGDGWGELLPSLENFPYEQYGIQIQGQ